MKKYIVVGLIFAFILCYSIKVIYNSKSIKKDLLQTTYKKVESSSKVSKDLKAEKLNNEGEKINYFEKHKKKSNIDYIIENKNFTESHSFSRHKKGKIFYRKNVKAE